MIIVSKSILVLLNADNFFWKYVFLWSFECFAHLICSVNVGVKYQVVFWWWHNRRKRRKHFRKRRWTKTEKCKKRNRANTLFVEKIPACNFQPTVIFNCSHYCQTLFPWSWRLERRYWQCYFCDEFCGNLNIPWMIKIAWFFAGPLNYYFHADNYGVFTF